MAPPTPTSAPLGTGARHGAEADAPGQRLQRQPKIATLQADTRRRSADSVTPLFKGETLRGLLLSSYAWSTVGQIAGIAAIAAFNAAAVMAVLVIAGLVHERRLGHAAS